MSSERLLLFSRIWPGMGSLCARSLVYDWFFIVTYRKVLFAGFETFSHHDADWSVWALGWGYTIAPYMVIAGFVGLIILARLFFGRSAFRVEPKNLVDLHTGRAQNLERLQGSKSKWRVFASNVLNY